jgi:hypothetical protein
MSNDMHPQAVLCVANEGNEVSLQLWKIYKPLRDDDAKSEGFIRVIDESGEDYLFPEENFVPIDLPNSVKRPFERAAQEQCRAAATPRSTRSSKQVRLSSRRTVKGPAGRGA